MEGNPEATINDVARIEEGRPGALSFLANPKYEKHIYDSQSSVVIVNNDFQPEKPVSATLVRVANAYEAFASLLQLYEENKPKKRGVSKLAAIDESVKLVKNIYIGEFAVIGENVVIEDHVMIYPQVYIGDNVKIKSNTILYPGVKIYHDCIIGGSCIFIQEQLSEVMVSDLHPTK